MTTWSNIGVIQAYRYLFVGYTLLHFAIAALYLVLPADIDLPKTAVGLTVAFAMVRRILTNF